MKREKVFEFSTEGWEAAKAYKPSEALKTKVIIGIAIGTLVVLSTISGVATAAYMPVPMPLIP